MRRHRILPLLLLFCGLSTTSFFSLEQSPNDGLTASSVPQCGSRLTGKARELNLACGRCGILLGENLREDFDLAETVECPNCGALNRLPG